MNSDTLRMVREIIDSIDLLPIEEWTVANSDTLRMVREIIDSTDLLPIEEWTVMTDAQVEKKIEEEKVETETEEYLFRLRKIEQKVFARKLKEPPVFPRRPEEKDAEYRSRIRAHVAELREEEDQDG